MGSTGPGTTDRGTAVGREAVGEADETDVREQLLDAAGPASDPEATVGGPTGRDLDTALSSANEADLAEQAREVPYDDDQP